MPDFLEPHFDRQHRLGYHVRGPEWAIAIPKATLKCSMKWLNSARRSGTVEGRCLFLSGRMVESLHSLLTSSRSAPWTRVSSTNRWAIELVPDLFTVLVTSLATRSSYGQASMHVRCTHFIWTATARSRMHDRSSGCHSFEQPSPTG